MHKVMFGGLILATTLVLSQCRDEIPDLELPDQSTSGLNTFGCLVNNRVWTNYGTACYTFGCADSNLEADLTKTADGKNEFYMWADYTVRKKRLFQSMSIYIPNLTGVGDFDSSDPSIVFHADDQYTIYKADGPGSVRVRITRYDTINSVISGEFSGKLKLTDGTGTLEITQGRFDVTID